MLGQRFINYQGFPKCIIKVGLSRDLDKRIRTYKSDNPTAVFISSTAGTEAEESKYHSYLAIHGKHYSGEWYEVSNDFYINCLQNGFKGFPLKDPKQNVYMHIQYTDDLLARQRIKNLYNENKNINQCRILDFTNERSKIKG
jgi:hypothetical protein